MNRKKWEAEVEKKPPVIIDTKGGYTFEQVMWNRNCSKDPEYWYKIFDTDRYLFKSDMAESWEFQVPSIENPIRNMKQIYLFFKQTNKFSERANDFKQFGYYCEYNKDEQEYDWFWDSEEDTCLDGKVIDGVRINGRYYFMLNYSQIEAREKFADGTFSKTKRTTFPYFLDHQFYLINEFEWWFGDNLYSNKSKYLDWFPLATEDDYESLQLLHGAVPKSRRLGVSYLVGNSVAAYDYIMKAGSFTLIGASDESKYETIRDESIKATINFTNQFTPWVRRSEVLKRMNEEFEASFYDYLDDNTRIVKGYQSRVKFVSLYQNSFKIVGKSLSKLLVEEAGVFPDLIESYGISMYPLCRDGSIHTGSIVLFGTSGDMSRNSIGLSKMSYNPETYNLVAYDNIYDSGATGKSSLFLDSLWYRATGKGITKDLLLQKLRDPYQIEFIKHYPSNENFGVDSNGNSIRFVANADWEIGYDKVRKDPEAAITYVTQNPRQLKEAFYVIESTGFDVETVRQAKIELRNAYESGEVVEHIGMFVENSLGTITFVESNEYNPILSYNRTSDKVPGCWVIWGSLPKGEIPQNRYIAGTDPIAKGYEEANGEGLHSLASTFILDTFTGLIVAEYTGRPPRVIDYNKNLFTGLKYFKAKTMYENNIQGLYQYAQQKPELLVYMAEEPNLIKNRPGYRGGGAQTKGYHTTGDAWLREELATFLEEPVCIGTNPTTNEPILVKRYYTIKSMAFLDELEMWNPEGNFDRIDAACSMVLYYLDSKRRFTAQRAKDSEKAQSVLSNIVQKRHQRIWGKN